MAADPFVTAVQRVGTDTVLAPKQRALVFDSDYFTVTDEPDETVTGADGATVEGVTFTTVKTSVLATRAYADSVATASVTSAAVLDALVGQALVVESLTVGDGFVFRSNTITTTDATPTTIVSVPLPSGTLATVRGCIMATSGTSLLKYSIESFVGNNAGVLDNIDTAVIGVDQNTVGGSSGISLSLSGSDLLFQITGKAATTLKWAVRLDVQTVAP